MRFVALIFALIPVFASAVDLSKAQRAAIEERIKPYSEVCVAGDDNCAGAATAVASGPRSGEDVYNGACMACHGTGAAGAPKLGDADAWAARIAKGGCGNCSDEEIHAAVDFMVESAQ